MVHWFYREYILKKKRTLRPSITSDEKKMLMAVTVAPLRLFFFCVCVKRALRQVYELVLEPWHCVYEGPPGLEIATRPPSKYCWKLIPPINAITFLVNLAAGVIIMLAIFRLCNLKIVLWQQKWQHSHRFYVNWYVLMLKFLHVFFFSNILPSVYINISRIHTCLCHPVSQRGGFTACLHHAGALICSSCDKSTPSKRCTVIWN